LYSDCLTDIRELECLSRLKTLELDTRLTRLWDEETSVAQLVISELSDLERLTIFVDKEVEEEAPLHFNWPDSKFSYSVKAIK